MITSRQNPKIKKVIQLSSQAKFRKASSAYVAEGVRILEDALRSGSLPEFILHTDQLDHRGKELLDTFQNQGVSCDSVDHALFQEASSTQTPQGILAVMPIKPPEIKINPDLVLILDEIRDPGNMGTLLRTALAAGTDFVLLSKGCVDPYSPKVVRSAMGAHYQLPLIQAAWDEIPIHTSGLQIILADAKADHELWEADLSGRVGVIIGSEAHGVSSAARDLANLQLRIPMDPRAESLNAAAAGAVLLFEARRQHLMIDR